MSDKRAPQSLLIARPRSGAELARLAFEIGNLHVPAEILDHEIRVLGDGPIEEVLERLGVPWVTAVLPFQPRGPLGTTTGSRR